MTSGDDIAIPAATAGDIVGERYRLERFIGVGGVGEVWQAHDLTLDAPVAVKLLHVPDSADMNLAQRMLYEARATARLAHPGIVKVMDFGTTSAGAPFLVMELLRGETLADLMNREVRLEPKRAAEILLALADALERAHARGVVHRDIKPENIFLAITPSGRLQPKLLDFGIARLMTSDRRLTMEGALVGTPDYMSPEQARGRGDVDFRSDIWSFCVVLYELIAGELPIQAPNPHALLYEIWHAEPKSLTELGLADAMLSSIIARGMRKDPEQRWPSMRALGSALALWLTEQGITEDIAAASLRARWLGPEVDRRSLMPEPPSSRELVTELEVLEDVNGAPARERCSVSMDVPPVGRTAPPAETPRSGRVAQWGFVAAVALASGLLLVAFSSHSLSTEQAAVAGQMRPAPKAAAPAASVVRSEPVLATPAKTAPVRARAELEGPVLSAEALLAQPAASARESRPAPPQKAAARSTTAAAEPPGDNGEQLKYDLGF